MTFSDLRNLAQLLHHLVKLLRVFQIQTYISASLEADLFRIDNEL